MAWIQPLIDREGEDLTLRTRSLGTRDSETGHPAVTYTETTIKASVVRTSSREVRTAGGDTVEVNIRIITKSAIGLGNEVVYHGETFVVVTEPVSHLLQYYYDVNARKVS